ncbi:MAG: T9SS type A sorting domain-containing protein [Candidatus Aegiribacteria sp.]|nr:T9SS type A sorting domain-containing protein [Candidatus Aegiribacteria sp.]
MKITAFVLVILNISILFASTYYVSTTGNNSNDGSINYPWATPGYGSKHISGGDSLIVLSGDYIMNLFYVDMITPPSGSSGSPTVIIGQGVTKPKMLGAGSLFSCIQLEDSTSFVEIINLELTSLIDTPYTGGSRGGFQGNSFINNILLEDLEIHRTEMMGIDLGGDAENIIINRCNIHHTAYTCIGGPAAIGDGWVNVQIDSCYLGYAGHFYQGEDTLSIWDRPDGVGFEESEGPIEIRYTFVEHTNGDGLDSKSRRTHIHHCIVSNCYADGIKLWGDSSIVENTLVYGIGDNNNLSTPWCALVIDTYDVNAYFKVTNCTFWDSPERPSHYLATIQYDCPTTPITLTMRNNIFCGNKRVYCQPIANIIANNNIFYVIDESIQITANGQDYDSLNIGNLGSDNTYGDPEFVFIPPWGQDGDFHLDQYSSGVDTGIDTGLLDDLDYFARPYNGVYDIGCYEWHPSTGVSERNGNSSTAAEKTMYISPNPAGATVRIEMNGDSVPSEIAIYDILGRLILKIASQNQQLNSFLWNTDGCNPGVYFAVANNNESVISSGRIVLLER